MAKVIVYSTPHCPYCTMVKKSGMIGVPQTEINGKIIVGFDRIALEEELEHIK